MKNKLRNNGNSSSISQSQFLGLHNPSTIFISKFIIINCGEFFLIAINSLVIIKYIFTHQAYNLLIFIKSNGILRKKFF